MFCTRCGSQNLDNAAFCAACGHNLGTQTPSPAPTDTLDEANTILAEQLIEGRVLAGRYPVCRRLGAGGMGEVWLAEDRELDGMPVAVKVLPPLLARNPRSVAALKREAALSLKLTHPNICRLYGFQSEGELKFLVMEYIDGQTLEDLLDQQDSRTLRLEQLLPIARQIAEALDYAHRLSPPVLHRDIKPGNIMVTSDGTAKLLDFGIARELKDSMTRVTGQQTTGTLLYMPPEQFAGKDPTPASDVYALAATLYECLKGRPPFHQGAIGHQLLHMQPDPIASQPEHVNDALLGGLAKDPSQRPSSAGALVADASSPPPPRESSPQPPQARPAAAGSTGRRGETGRASSAASRPPSSSSGATSISARSSFGAGKWLAVALVLAGLIGVYAFQNDMFPANSGSPDKGALREARRRQSATAKALGLTSTTKTLKLGNNVTMELVLVPAGTFTMGSPEGEGDSDEHPQRTVTIRKPFWMGKTEVTQAQYEAVTGKSPWKGERYAKENPQHAASYISWDAATAFCKALSKTTKQTVRLPTEAEWEYACRSGSEDAFSFGDDASKLGDYAWYDDNADDKGNDYAHPVGKKTPNAWGLHDMHGNVWEWCNDWYQSSYKGLSANDPKGPNNKSYRVLRGGSWFNDPATCRSAHRFWNSPDYRGYKYGFRVAVDFK